MRRITFHEKGNRSGDLLHVETDGCVVNIRVGLSDDQGRKVTRVDVLPDDDTRGGDGLGHLWCQDGPRVIRMNPGETAGEVRGTDPAAMSIAGAVRWATQSRDRLAWLLERGLTECDARSLREQILIILAEQGAALAVLADPYADERS